MKVAVFNTRPYDRLFLEAANEAHGHDLCFLVPALNEQTVSLAMGCPAVSAFVNDTLDRPVLTSLSKQGTRLLALRAAGFNNVDVEAAEDLDLAVVRVPAYSPYAVAEHTVALILALNRKLHRAFTRVHDQNFSLDGLMGFDLRGRTMGVLGTGKVGAVVARIMTGFGCRVLATDVAENGECLALGVQYVPLEELAAESDILSLHCPLIPQTHRVIDEALLATMKPGVMLINTSRGALIDTQAVIRALKSGRLGYLGIDVYAEESDLFFRDLSEEVIQDDVFARLLTFPNVAITAHQAFFTRDALTSIAQITMQNVTDFAAGAIPNENRVKREHVR